MRAEKSALKKQEEASKAIAKAEAIAPRADQHFNSLPKEEESEEAVEYIKKTRSRERPKPKKRIVVVEDSSSEEEIEVRLPRKRLPSETAKEAQSDYARRKRAYDQMFSLWAGK